MRMKSAFLAAVAGWLAASILGCQLGPEEAGRVRDGRGIVRLLDEKDWKEAEADSLIYAGDLVATGDSQKLRLSVDGSELVMDENSTIFVGGETSEGYRKIGVREGDFFVSVFQNSRRPLWLDTPAGSIYCRSGFLIVRLVPRRGGGDTSAVHGPEMQMNVMVVGGEAVLENSQLPRRIPAGHLCFSETGAPPAAPVEMNAEAIAETRLWLREQFPSEGGFVTALERPAREIFVPRKGPEEKEAPPLEEKKSEPEEPKDKSGETGKKK
jgi:hypothetical protein